MTREEFLDKQYELSFTAGMNQRYHQRYATWWWRWDTSAKIVTAILAVASAMLSVGAMFKEHPAELDLWALIVASLAATAAVILNVVPFGTWEQEHRDLLRQWTDLREDSESLLFECPNDPIEHHVGELKKLDSKLHRLCGDEPSPDVKLLDKCLKDEKKSRPQAADAA